MTINASSCISNQAISDRFAELVVRHNTITRSITQRIALRHFLARVFLQPIYRCIEHVYQQDITLLSQHHIGGVDLLQRLAQRGVTAAANTRFSSKPADALSIIEVGCTCPVSVIFVPEQHHCDITQWQLFFASMFTHSTPDIHVVLCLASAQGLQSANQALAQSCRLFSVNT
ncbi:hypothetical protein D3C85_823390 [compost metagenome]